MEEEGSGTRAAATPSLWWAAAAAAGVWAARQAVRTTRRIEFRDRVALVTGGSRGLGLELARQLLDQGARVAICARDGDTLERARAELVGRAGDEARVLAVPCDVTDAAQVCDMVSAVRERLGPIDVLINNAGVISVGPTEHMTLAEYDEAMRVNFYGPLHLVLAVAPAMRERRTGRIVNIASIAGKAPEPHLIAYSASKFALVGLSEGLRVSMQKDGVLVTTVCPGEMRTGSPRHATFKGDHEAEYAWFTASDNVPGPSMSAVRAASRILDACRHGDAELIMPAWSWAQAKLHGLAPALSQRIGAVAERAMPLPVAREGDVRRSGAESDSPRTPEWARAAQAAREEEFGQRG